MIIRLSNSGIEEAVLFSNTAAPDVKPITSAAYPNLLSLLKSLDNRADNKTTSINVVDYLPEIQVTLYDPARWSLEDKDKTELYQYSDDGEEFINLLTLEEIAEVDLIEGLFF